MAKNETQKILKALMYIAKSKGYLVGMTSNQYYTYFSKTDNWDFLLKKYKSYVTGRLEFYSLADQDNVKVFDKTDMFAYFYFSINDNTITASSDTYSESARNSQSLLNEAKFFVNINAV